MKIYIRTPAGNEAALNPKSALPRKLRTLLIAIDGKTRLSTYVSSLSSFGDVEALIESLLDAGLIEVMEFKQRVGYVGTEKSAGSVFADTVNAESQASGKFTRSRTDLGTTSWRSPQIQNRSLGSEPVDDLISSAKFQQQPQPQAFKSASAQPTTTAGYQLRNAILLMSDFVSQHMPVESLELVLVLEGQTSVEQVIINLKGYESLIAHVGEPARQHLIELRSLLSSN